MSPRSSRRRRKRLRKRAGPLRPAQVESRVGEAVTVAWTMTVVTLLVCELSGLVAAMVLRWHPGSDRLRLFVGLAQFSALVLAIVSMGLLPIVYRVRRVAPPPPLVAIAVVAAAAPFVLALWQILN